MRYFTPEEFVLERLASYPSLYSASTIEDTSIKIYEQLFNVIGNGIRDSKELAEELEYHEFDKDLALKFITNEELAYGYTKVRDFGSFVMGDGEAHVVVKESEKPLHPEVIHWVDFTSGPRESPYPNFKKEYSIIYRSNFVEYGVDWINAAITYYTWAQNFFESEDASKYHSAYPCYDEDETERALENYKKFTEKYETKEQIEEAYGVKYNGDIEDLAIQQWKKEHARIKSFIKETLEMLNEAKEKCVSE